MNFAIISPVHNDWESAGQLCRELSDTLGMSGHSAELWFVDDGSNNTAPPAITFPTGLALTLVNCIQLHENHGHQRAIAIGISYLFRSERTLDGILVMDCDGEDKPSALASILALAAVGNSVVIAERAKRSERFIFRIGYAAYRALFFLSTGQSITFGNFVYLPAKFIRDLVQSPHTELHLAATIMKLGLESESVKVDRGIRYFGKSRMRFASLVAHGLTAISVFGKPALRRFTALTLLVVIASLAGMFTLIGAQLAWGQNTLRSAAFYSLFFSLVVLQCLCTSLYFCFLVLSARSLGERSAIANPEPLIKTARTFSKRGGHLRKIES